MRLGCAAFAKRLAIVCGASGSRYAAIETKIVAASASAAQTSGGGAGPAGGGGSGLGGGGGSAEGASAERKA